MPNKIDEQERELIRDLWIQGYDIKYIEQALGGKIKRRAINWHVEKLEREYEVAFHRGLLGKFVSTYNRFGDIAFTEISNIRQEMEANSDNPKVVIALRSQLREYMEFVHTLLGDGPTVAAVRKMNQEMNNGKIGIPQATT